MPECRRPGCDETFDDRGVYSEHLLRDHDLPWNEIADYPRAPSERG